MAWQWNHHVLIPTRRARLNGTGTSGAQPLAAALRHSQKQRVPGILHCRPRRSGCSMTPFCRCWRKRCVLPALGSALPPAWKVKLVQPLAVLAASAPVLSLIGDFSIFKAGNESLCGDATKFCVAVFLIVKIISQFTEANCHFGFKAPSFLKMEKLRRNEGEATFLFINVRSSAGFAVGVRKPNHDGDMWVLLNMRLIKRKAEVGLAEIRQPLMVWLKYSIILQSFHLGK